MTATIHHPRFGSTPRPVSDNPMTRFIDEMHARQDERSAWLRTAGAAARRMNAESANDGDGPEAA